jgi:dihydropteroate synthase
MKILILYGGCFFYNNCTKERIFTPVKLSGMYTLNCKGRLLSLEKPLVMGIINITPDSFFAGSRHLGTEKALRQAEKMVKEGAAILDIGGQSTRPGAERVGEYVEMDRVIPVIEAVSKAFPEVEISVDTFYSKVAAEAVVAGASIINDISAGLIDPEMLPVVASLNVPYVCMHMKGEPGTMQQSPEYEDVTREVLDFFIRRIEDCRKAGIKDVIADPGFGFGKTIAHNFTLIRELEAFGMLGVPLLMGISRKSTIYKTLGISAEEALNGSSVLHTIGLMKGVNILRVHDVKEAVEAVKLVESVGFN